MNGDDVFLTVPQLPVIELRRCRCGAVEFTWLGNPLEPVNIAAEDYAIHFPSVPLPEVTYVHCNHCVNRWGLTICGCGSGEPAGECGNEYEECQMGRAYQSWPEWLPRLVPGT